eukprot:1157930-Pelagomonas_calceolata.AAC.3
MVMRVAHEARNRLLMHQASDASGGGTCRAWGRFLEWGVGPAQQRSGKTPGDDRFVAWQKFDKSHMHGARAH